MAVKTRASERDLKLGDLIRDEIARVLLADARDPRLGMTNVTEVRVSRDLSVADVYVRSLPVAHGARRRELLAALDHAAGFLRSAIARRNALRATPRLRFRYDDLVEAGPRIEALIDRAVAADQGTGA